MVLLVCVRIPSLMRSFKEQLPNRPVSPSGCSIQEELMMSFEQLLTISDRTGKPFDRIVLENSGVAEPRNIRDKFSEAVEAGNPLMNRIHLSTLV